jgi:alpha-glucosidase
MVPGQVAASSIAAMALGLLIEMVPSGSMIWPPPDDLTHSRASQVRPSYELPCQTKPQMSGYDVSDYRDIDPAFGTLADFDDMVAKAHRLGLKVIIDQVLSHCSNQHPFFLEARSSRDNPKSDWFVWADPNPDGSAPNNWQSIFGGIAWEWEPRRKQYYFHNFLKEQPDFNFHNPEVQEYALETMRFWLDRGVDGFRLDTVNFYFHDQMLRNDAADFRPEARDAANPYYMLYHLYSKNQPENVPFLERMRALLDEYEGRTMVGEVGEWHHALELMGRYTTGKRLHMAYSFDMLGFKYSAGHFRKTIEDFFAIAPKGWPCWAFSNQDVVRHATRWQPFAKDTDALAKQAGALLLSLEGSICLYQGEETGQLETELRYDELTDPQGLTFWPEDKGRDGCRTPMVWDAKAPNGGFSEANATWLPIKPPQLAHAVSEQGAGSVMQLYKDMLRLRRDEADLRNGRTEFLELPEPLLGFKRGGGVVCVFNLSPEGHSIEVPFAVDPLLAEGAELDGTRLVLAANGVMIGRIRGA